MNIWKSFATIILLLSCSYSLTAQETEITDSVKASRKRVAVVLSGGGAKGMAHIGALKVIEEAGIPIDIVTGTSMGSIIGGLYSIGYDSHMLDSLVRVQDWTFVLSDREEMRQRSLNDRKRQNTYILTKPIILGNSGRINHEGGFIAGRNLATLFDRLTAEYPDSMDFNRLPIPFACVATNIVDNSEYDFHSGRLAQAMRASMAIPAVFSPVRIGDMVLVDGGLRNNYPVDIAREMGADVVIGVSVQSEDRTAEELGSTMSVLNQIIDINCKNKYEDNWLNTDVPVRVDVKGYTSASFTAAAIDTLIRRGEEAARNRWDDLLALKQTIGLPQDYRPEKRPLPQHASVPEQPEPNKDFDARHVITTSVAFRFDNEEAAALQIEAKTGMLRGFDSRLTIRLGKRIMGQVELAKQGDNTLRPNMVYTFRHNDIDIYHKGDKSYGITYNQSSADLSLIDFNVRNFNVTLGGIWDYFHYSDVLVRSEINFERGKPLNDHYISYIAKVKYNSEDKWYFPTRGAKFYAHYAYRTDDFAQMRGKPGLSDVSASWRKAFSLSEHFVIQPMAYARMLFGRNIPHGYANFAGGDQFGHYVEQQLPLTGLGHIEIFENHLAAMQLRSQLHIGTNNYFILNLSAAEHNSKLRNLLSEKPILGIQASYAYNTFFGPLGASLGYSTFSKKPYCFINIGFMF